MSIRQTYALDTETVSSIKELAKIWSVSQAEALRRAVRHTRETSMADSKQVSYLPGEATPVESWSRADALRYLSTHSLIDATQLEYWQKDLRDERVAWDKSIDKKWGTH